MNNIKEFFESKTDNIYFLELKDKSMYGFPLPIIKSDFMDELKNETFEEEWFIFVHWTKILFIGMTM